MRETLEVFDGDYSTQMVLRPKNDNDFNDMREWGWMRKGKQKNDIHTY